jgi:hypothetical protein
MAAVGAAKGFRALDAASFSGAREQPASDRHIDTTTNSDFTFISLS